MRGSRYYSLKCEGQTRHELSISQTAFWRDTHSCQLWGGEGPPALFTHQLLLCTSCPDQSSDSRETHQSLWHTHDRSGALFWICPMEGVCMTGHFCGALALGHKGNIYMWIGRKSTCACCRLLWSSSVKWDMTEILLEILWLFHSVCGTCSSQKSCRL